MKEKVNVTGVPETMVQTLKKSEHKDLTNFYNKLKYNSAI